jgi:DNA-binding NarL/FixJ family response regulator
MAEDHDLDSARALPAPIRVLVVDDHRAVADAIALAIGGASDLICLGTAHNVEDAFALTQRLEPDVVVMDVRLGDGDGVELTARLTARFPELRVVILTAVVDHGLLQRAAEAGASGIFPKDGSLADVLSAVRSARVDDLVVHPSLLRKLALRPTPGPVSVLSLTSREQDVLTLMADGQDSAQIARRLGISLLTCRGYVKSLLTKLDAHSQLEAVVVATRLGLVRVGEDRQR